MKTLITLNILLISLTVNAQLTYQKTLGGNQQDIAKSIQKTTDNGYIIAGETENFGAGDFDVFLTKVDSNGTALWSKAYGSTGKEYAHSLKQTFDGGYVVVGQKERTTQGTWDIFMLRVNSNGDTLWTKTYGGTNVNDLDIGYSVDQTTDGGFIVTGHTWSYGLAFGDIYLLKTDSTGQAQWAKTYGGSVGGDVARSVKQTADNGFIIAGMTQSFGAGGIDIYIIKTNNLGDTLWTKTFGGSGQDYAWSVIQTLDGSYAITGYTQSFGAGNADMFLLKLSNSGAIQWSKTYGGTNADWGQQLIQTNDLGYAILGHTNSFGAGSDDIYLIKTDSTGNLSWSKTFGGSLSEQGYSLQQSNDNGFIITGTTSSFSGNYIYLIKTDALGKSNCNESTQNSIVNNFSPQVSSGTVINSGFLNINTNTVLNSFTFPSTTLCYQYIEPPIQTQIKIIDGRLGHSIILCIDGTVWTTGSNTSGQLGNGTTINKNSPIQVSGLSDIVAVAAGDFHSLALKNDGTVWAWGDNGYGQLGDGTTTLKTTPVQVNGLTGVRAIEAGASHSIAIKKDSTVWAWGYNFFGQLGDSTTTNKTSPVKINSLSNIISIDAGDYHSIALKDNGTVYSWGRNNNGQLGDGTIVNKNYPIALSSINEVVAIATGSNHSLAKKSDETIWSWGLNQFGQLGDNTTTDKSSPTQILNLSSSIKVTAGLYHSMVFVNDSTILSWGRNNTGQLGDGTTSDKLAPIQVPNFSNINTISAGGATSLAVKNNGTVWGWGNNNPGQLGDGTMINKATPVQMLITCTVGQVLCVSTYSTQNISSCDNYLWNGNIYTISGTYIDTLLTAMGCDSVMTLNLTINTVDTSVTVSANSLAAISTGASYQWLDCNNNYAVISGATNQTFTPTATGNYAVILSLNGCVDTSSCYNVIVTGILNINDNDKFIVYPNPTSGIFIIEHTSVQNIPFEITDISGRLIKTGVLTDKRISIDLSKNENGIYLLKIAGRNMLLLKQ
jgi:alpha-tubulin suppressor-like RCC1 family protein